MAASYAGILLLGRAHRGRKCHEKSTDWLEAGETEWKEC
jgi:hypothetical protein